MASQLKVDTITGVTTAGSISVTGEGNSTTTNLQQGLAKAFAHITGAGFTLTDGFNASSTTDGGTGKVTLSYTNSMSNTTYSTGGITYNRAAGSSNAEGGLTTSATHYQLVDTGGSVSDIGGSQQLSTFTFGDLA
tara:strand:+ start:367 stop:771 length:405 start_codon:yes stop_codon:yes gene_type:complete